MSFALFNFYSDFLGDQCRTDRDMLIVAQHQLQSVFARRQLQHGLGLAFAKVHVVRILGNRLGHRSQWACVN